MRRFLRIFMGVLCMGLILSAWGSYSTRPTQLFFVLHSTSGSLVAQHDSGNHYILTLNDVPKDIPYFSDRPRHIVGSVLLNKVTIAWSKRLNEHFSGALSFRDASQRDAPLITTIVKVNHYVFLVNKDRVVAQVVLANPALRASRYDLKDIMLQTDGMWFLPYLFGHS